MNSTQTARDKAKAYLTNQRQHHRPVRIKHVMALTGWSHSSVSKFVQTALVVREPKPICPKSRKRTPAQKQADALRRAC